MLTVIRCSHFGNAAAKIFVLVHAIKLVQEIVMIRVKANVVEMLGLELLKIKGATYLSN